jgi:hypothetical protein
MTKANKKNITGKKAETAASVDADHLAEIDVADGAEQGLQRVAQHQGSEETEERGPERL